MIIMNTTTLLFLSLLSLSVLVVSGTDYSQCTNGRLLISQQDSSNVHIYESDDDNTLTWTELPESPIHLQASSVAIVSGTGASLTALLNDSPSGTQAKTGRIGASIRTVSEGGINTVLKPGIGINSDGSIARVSAGLYGYTGHVTVPGRMTSFNGFDSFFEQSSGVASASALFVNASAFGDDSLSVTGDGLNAFSLQSDYAHNGFAYAFNKDFYVVSSWDIQESIEKIDHVVFKDSFDNVLGTMSTPHGVTDTGVHNGQLMLLNGRAYLKVIFDYNTFNSSAPLSSVHPFTYVVPSAIGNSYFTTPGSFQVNPSTGLLSMELTNGTRSPDVNRYALFFNFDGTAQPSMDNAIQIGGPGAFAQVCTFKLDLQTPSSSTGRTVTIVAFLGDNGYVYVQSLYPQGTKRGSMVQVQLVETATTINCDDYMMISGSGRVHVISRSSKTLYTVNLQTLLSGATSGAVASQTLAYTPFDAVVSIPPGGSCGDSSDPDGPVPGPLNHASTQTSTSWLLMVCAAIVACCSLRW